MPVSAERRRRRKHRAGINSEEVNMNSKSPSSRREFLGLSAGLLLGAPAFSHAVRAPSERSGQGTRLRLGLAAYSFRDHFAFMKGKEREFKPGTKVIDMLGFIDFCAEHGVDGAELTSYFFPPDVGESDFLARCRHRAHVSGVSIAGTAVGNNFSHPAGSRERDDQMTYVRQWIDYAARMGAPHIRVFAGKHPSGVSEEAAEKNAIAALEEAGDHAGKLGIFLGIENHDSIGSADRLLRIVKAVESPWVGVNLDTGNFRTDDPYADIAVSAPFAVNVQVKVALRVAGKKEEADLPRIARLLSEANYRGFVVLEYEEADDPFESVPVALDKLRAAISG